MMTEILLNDIEKCQYNIDLCIDAIHNLQGDLPDGIAFTFSMKGLPVVQFEIGEGEANFALSFFMSWHQYYSKQLKALKAAHKCGFDKQT